jgi:hypothetical protein
LLEAKNEQGLYSKGLEFKRIHNVMALRKHRKTTVPYFVLRLDPSTVENDLESDKQSSLGQSSSSLHRTKALFTVPEDIAPALIIHPILCCGSSFTLLIDDAVPQTQQQRQQPSSSNNDTKSQTMFLSTMFDSLFPEDTAQEIAQRLSIRIDNVGAAALNATECLGLE